jgi:membrane fusion protein, multidrug efflux system
MWCIEYSSEQTPRVRSGRPRRFFGTAGSGLALFVCILLGSSVAEAAEASKEVGVISLARQNVPRIFKLPGRAIASQKVNIRPRVGGVIEKILYDPAKPVSAGDPLYKLDDSIYVAAVATAKADVAIANANFSNSQATYKRANTLKGEGYSAAQVEAYQATMKVDQAKLDAAQAALNYAKVQASWTLIHSPISGFVAMSNVYVGDLVSEEQSDALTVVSQLDPIEVHFQEASASVLQISKQVDSGAMKLMDTPTADLKLQDGVSFESSGKFLSTDNAVSTTTGTTALRFQFENPEHKVLPGMFLRADVKVGTVSAYLIPQRAASRDAGGQLTAFVVDDKGKATQVRFDDNGVHNNSWIVETGFSDGQKLIVSGLASLATGTPVTAKAVKLNADGLVQSDPAATKEKN